MKKIIYYISFILLLFLISVIPVSAKEIKTCTRTESNLHVRNIFNLGTNLDDIMSTPCVDEKTKVYDFADLFSDLEEENLYNQISSFIELTNYDLVVVTINDNPKGNVDNYADDFYDYNEFGYNSTRDGVLLLIDLDTRNVKISTTGYAIKMYDDNRIESIIDSGYSSLKSGNYYNSINLMIGKLNYYYTKGVSNINKYIEIDEYGKPIIIKHINYLFVGFISLIITLIVAIIFYNLSRLKVKVGSTVSYLKDKKITLKNDSLVNSVVTHTLRNTDSGSGHSSGGSSYHSSSSGSFHGGGSRGF